MSLRLRLMLVIGLPFLVLWVAASTWMLVDLRAEFMSALDERLAASAHMVAGLLAQSPAKQPAMSPARTVTSIGAMNGVACKIRMLRGGVVARTANSPEQLGIAAPGYRTRTIGGERWRSFTLDENGVRVTTADRVERRQQLLRGVAAGAAIPVIIATVGSLLALWIGVRNGLAPLESIRAALAAREPDALHPVPSTRVPAELSPLVAAINALLARVGGALERERRFTGDAAHELRTPLTAVKTHIQVARLSPHSDGKELALQHAEQGVRRLQHTIEQLLMLARLDGPFLFDSNDVAGAATVAHAALAQIAPDLTRQVAVAAEGPDSVLAMPAALAVTALRNLLDNAIRYSPVDSEVLLRFETSDGSIVFYVEDRGCAMSEQESERAIERFWRNGRGQGSGLGLSIVETIVKRFDGDLRLSARPGGGLVARLRLPAAA
ncbi:ATP-binding protein [Massilia sp. TWR1-2-2]|uniref:ATP-binding protein n=1 Tax=Massilia sp. TWR1-2-2 TaxID=2804584 RepID=UPI003CF35DF2